MSYENAPATILLATHCACCGRPLVDAASVETGIGPDCRKRHGFVEAQGDPDWPAVESALDGCPVGTILFPSGVAAVEASWRLGGLETRRVANQLVYLVAQAASGLGHGPALIFAAVTALRALGFTKLAGVLSKRIAKVQIEERDGRLFVATPFTPDVVKGFRIVPGRRWEKKEKLNSFPSAERRRLFAVLRRCFPGVVAVGPKGFFILEPARLGEPARTEKAA